jgi:hypothetical protein
METTRSVGLNIKSSQSNSFLKEGLWKKRKKEREAKLFKNKENTLISCIFTLLICSLHMKSTKRNK